MKIEEVEMGKIYDVMNEKNLKNWKEKKKRQVKQPKKLEEKRNASTIHG